jgi:hypothetical protein
MTISGIFKRVLASGACLGITLGAFSCPAVANADPGGGKADHQIAVQYVGVLDAAAASHQAPAADRAAIGAEADHYPASVGSVRTSGVAASPDFDWGDVLRVAGSYVECMAIREIYLWWYPLAVCVPNPDGNGTWLVVIVP